MNAKDYDEAATIDVLVALMTASHYARRVNENANPAEGISDLLGTMAAGLNPALTGGVLGGLSALAAAAVEWHSDMAHDSDWAAAVTCLMREPVGGCRTES